MTHPEMIESMYFMNSKMIEEIFENTTLMHLKSITGKPFYSLTELHLLVNQDIEYQKKGGL